MPDAKTPAQIRQLVRNNKDSYQKIRRKPKVFNPNVDRRNSSKNKFKESFGGENV